MQRIFSHENDLIVHIAKSQLDSNEIKFQIKHEHLPASIDLAPMDRYLSLWLEDDEDIALATKLLRSFSEEDEEEVVSDWFCNECKENNDPSFEWCWSCHYDRHSHVKH